MNDHFDPEPFYIAFRHAQTGAIEHLHIDPWLTYNQMKAKVRQRVGTRAGEMFDWVGVKRGDRVLFRGKREEDGTWSWDEIDVRRGVPAAQDTLV